MTLDEEARLLSEVETCVEAIARVLPQLTATHSPLAVLIALSLHTNASQELAVQTGRCSLEKAHELLRGITALDVDPQRLKMHGPKNQKGCIRWGS
jgi:hypothetical protein